jgi:iron-regulated transporter 1
MHMIGRVLILVVVGQRLAVMVSCVGFGLLLLQPSWLSKGLEVTIFVSLVFLCCMEKLYSIVNLVAVERDWVGAPVPGNFHEAVFDR